MAQPFIRVIGIVTGIIQSWIETEFFKIVSVIFYHNVQCTKKLDVREGSDAAMVSAIVSESWGKTSLVVGA
jgi:hypothetical protein